MLGDWVEMRWDGIPVRKRQPHGERAALGGITVEDCKLGTRGEHGRRRIPFHRIRNGHDDMLRGSSLRFLGE